MLGHLGCPGEIPGHLTGHFLAVDLEVSGVVFGRAERFSQIHPLETAARPARSQQTVAPENHLRQIGWERLTAERQGLARVKDRDTGRLLATFSAASAMRTRPS